VTDHQHRKMTVCSLHGVDPCPCGNHVHPVGHESVSSRSVARFCICGHEELMHDDDGNCANCECGGFMDEETRPRKDLE
jgi:hypothetical protein